MILTTGAVVFLVFFLRIKQMLTHFWRTNSSDSYVLCSTCYDNFFWSFITAFDEYSRLPVYTSFFAKDEHTRHTNLFSLQLFFLGPAVKGLGEYFKKILRKFIFKDLKDQILLNYQGISFFFRLVTRGVSWEKSQNMGNKIFFFSKIKYS